MSRTLRVVGGVGLGQLHLVVVTLVGLWLTPFLLGRVGQHDYGLWLVGLQLVAYLQLLDFGVVALLPRETAFASGRARVNGDQGTVADTVALIRGVIRWQMPAVAIASVAAWAWLPASWSDLRAPLAWVLAFFVVTFPARAYHAALQGLQDLVFLGKVQIAAWVTGTTTMIGLVLAGQGLSSLVAGWITTQLVTFLACGWRMRAAHPAVWRARVPFASWSDARRYFARSVWVSITQVSQVLLGGSDVLVIGWLLGPSAVVPYACTAKLVQVLANHPQMLMQAAAPALSEMRVSERRSRLVASTSALTRAMLVISGAVACGVIAVNGPFVTWWVGPSQYGGWPLTIMLALAMVARHLNTTTVYTVFCFGHERRTALTSLADGVVTFAASMIGLRLFGLYGVPLGSLVGVLSVSFLPNLVLLARELGVSIAAPLVDLSGWMVRFAVCAGFAALLGFMPFGGAFGALIARGALAATMYLVVMVPYALSGTLGAYTWPFIERWRRSTHPPTASAA
jgi:O-antigen/teichoic acid export membrane protein